MLWLLKRNGLEDDSSSGVIRLDGRLLLDGWTYRPGTGFGYQARLSLQFSVWNSSTSIKLVNEYRNEGEVRHHLKRTAGRSDS